MTLPAFIIAGASFSGAEILHALLKENPALCFPKGKPSAFFYRSDLYARGIEAYQNLFAACDPHRLTGDMGVPYFERGIVLNAGRKYGWQPQEDSALRIKKHCPHARIILCLRDPLRRMELQFRQAQATRIEKAPDLATALTAELEGARKPENHPLCYLARNLYSEHILHWKRLFGAGNLHILVYESFMADIETELARAEKSIGVRPHAADRLAIARAKGEIPAQWLPAFEILGLFPSLRPLLHYAADRLAKKPSGQESIPSVPEAATGALARDRAQLETVTGITGLEALWTAPAGK